MATVKTLAHEALDHLFITEGGEEPSAEDSAKAVSSMLRVLSRLPEYGGGRTLVDETVTEAVTAKPDGRYVVAVTGLTITLPADPQDGARVAVVPIAGSVTVKPDNRKVEGGTASLSVTDGTTWAYRADLADWVKVTDLSSGSESPWPASCDAALGHFCAKEAAAKFSAQITPELGMLISESEAFIRSKYVRPREQDWGASVPYSIQGPGRLRRYR